MRNLLILAIVAIVVGLAYAGIRIYPYTSYFGSSCEAKGGKWASASGQCITRSCYKDDSCGLWSNPGNRCHLLRVGDPVSEVYFQLGEPYRIDGTRYTWPVGKLSDYEVVIGIVNGRAASIVCSQRITNRSAPAS